MKPNYDFSKGKKPHYEKRFPGGAIISITSSNGIRHKRVNAKPVVQLDSDVSKVFPNGRAVNTAPRHLIAAMPKH